MTVINSCECLCKQAEVSFACTQWVPQMTRFADRFGLLENLKEIVAIFGSQFNVNDTNN